MTIMTSGWFNELSCCSGGVLEQDEEEEASRLKRVLEDVNKYIGVSPDEDIKRDASHIEQILSLREILVSKIFVAMGFATQEDMLIGDENKKVKNCAYLLGCIMGEHRWKDNDLAKMRSGEIAYSAVKPMYCVQDWPAASSRM